MMSGDSPNSHARDIFDFKDDRNSPIPTTSQLTSKELAIQSTCGAELITASVLVEPLKGCPVVSPPDSHPGRKNNDGAIISADEASLRAQDSGDKNEKMNGTVDSLDSKWIPPLEDKKQEEEEDPCAIKCLYYTMQCCECTIM